MDVLFFFARLTILFPLLLQRVHSLTLRTYRMEEYCKEEISMILGDFHSGKLVFTSDGLSNCSVIIESWYSNPYIQFYFEDFNVGTEDCTTGKLIMKDGNSVYAPKITDLGPKLCGSETPAGVYRTYTRYLRIEYEAGRYHPGRPSSFSIIFNAFDVGICESFEFRCDNGNCINDELKCNGYNPCGDHSDCRLSVGVIVGIVLGSLAGFAILVTVIVVLICCYRRHKSVPPPRSAATGYVISTSASQPHVFPPSSSNPWYSAGQQQVFLGANYANSPVLPMPQAQTISQPAK